MNEWEILLLVSAGTFVLLTLVSWIFDKMKNMVVAILECMRSISQLKRDVSAMKIQLDSMAAREAKRLREERIS